MLGRATSINSGCARSRWGSIDRLVSAPTCRARIREREAATEAFVTAAAKSDAVLQFAANFNALDSKGVALSGLVLCGDASRLTPAIEAHRSARAINRDAGVVGRVVWLYDQMAPADAAGQLETARAAVGGTGV